jgi:transcriptional regulator with XRE-family HTH domain
MIYERQIDLILAIRGAGLTYRDLGNLLKVSPGTISARLNGYSTMPVGMKTAILARITEAGAGRAKAREGVQ